MRPFVSRDGKQTGKRTEDPPLNVILGVYGLHFEVDPFPARPTTDAEDTVVGRAADVRFCRIKCPR